jgi:hypothetical protein
LSGAFSPPSRPTRPCGVPKPGRVPPRPGTPPPSGRLPLRHIDRSHGMQGVT